jgi:hypothetical protein
VNSYFKGKCWLNYWYGEQKVTLCPTSEIAPEKSQVDLN